MELVIINIVINNFIRSIFALSMMYKIETISLSQLQKFDQVPSIFKKLNITSFVFETLVFYNQN